MHVPSTVCTTLKGFKILEEGFCIFKGISKISTTPRSEKKIKIRGCSKGIVCNFGSRKSIKEIESDLESS
jgi:hypothetical protein